MKLKFSKAAGLCLLVLAAAIGGAQANPTTNQVLILASTVTTGLPVPGGCLECQAVLALGLVPNLVTDAAWTAMTAAQFSTYRAIVIGDPTCGSYINSAAVANAAVWQPQVTGNVVVLGTDPVFHTRFTNPAIYQTLLSGINFTVADATKVGAYVCLSCAYSGSAANTPVPLLSGFGTFTAQGASCFDNAHIVAKSPALAGLSDSVLSDWGCSVHNVFNTMPGNFLPLVIALDIAASGTLTFADGSQGVPYIVARGATPVLCGDGVIQPPEQCDDGPLNGVAGDKCSSVCTLGWCGDGVVNGGEQCDLGAQNGVAGSGCSSTCTPTGPVCNPPCGAQGTCQFVAGSTQGQCACNAGWSGPQCQCQIPSQFLATDYQPTLDVSRSGFLTKNTLQLWVNVSSKYYDVGINFLNVPNSNCSYPSPLASGSNYWQATFYGPPACVWTIVGNIPWSDAWNECLWQRQQTVSYTTFSGQMYIATTETLGSLRNVSLARTEQNAASIEVTFPNYVSVTSGQVTTFSAFIVQAAIVQQTYTITVPPNGVGSVRLYVSLQWPYAIQGPLNASSNSNALPITVTGPEVNPAACPNDGHSTCQQWFDFTIVPAVGQCTLNGAYMFNFFVSCVSPSLSGGHACPLLSPVAQSIGFTLQSTYFCQEIISNVQATASLTSYATSAFATVSYDFAVGQTGFWLIQTSSAQVSITATSIAQLYAIAPNGTSILLYTVPTGNTAAGNLLSLSINNAYAGKGSPATQNTFQLVYVPSFFAVPTDGYLQWTFSATAALTFLNTGATPLANNPVVMAKTGTKTDTKFAAQDESNSGGNQAGLNVGSKATISLSGKAADTSSASSLLPRPSVQVAIYALLAILALLL